MCAGTCSAHESLDARGQGDGVDLLPLLGGEAGVLDGLDVVEDLLGLGGADEDGGDVRVLEVPGEGHLGELAQRADGLQLLGRQGLLLEKAAVAADAAVLGNAAQVAVGQETLAERAEGDDSEAEVGRRILG